MPSNMPMKTADLSRAFWDEIGIDPSNIEKITITIETDKFVTAEIRQTLQYQGRTITSKPYNGLECVAKVS